MYLFHEFFYLCWYDFEIFKSLYRGFVYGTPYTSCERYEGVNFSHVRVIRKVS